MKKIILITLITGVFSFNINAQSIPINGNGSHYYGPNSTWGAYLTVGGNGRTTTNASVVTTNGNLHLDSKNGRNTYINHYSKTNTYLNTQGGNVGIGIGRAEERLHVNGSIRGNAAGGALRLKSTHGYMDIGAQNTSWAHIYTDRPKIIFNKDVYTTSNAFSSYNNDLILKTEGNERLRINDDTGNIGIGTSSPTSKLDVNGKTTVNSLRIDGSNETHSVNNFRNKIEFTGLGHGAIVFKPGDAKELMFGFHDNGNFYWGTGKSATKPNYYAMFLDGDTGNLGIRGKLTSNEVKVKLGGWADYVFEENYALPTLSQVEDHIKTKGHLINIPSATEVETNGVELGEMNKLLLEKIEELTLYTIEQEKKLTTQESTNKKLETKNKKIEARLAKIESLLLKK